MLFAISKGIVDGYDGGQAEVVYLCSTAQSVQNRGLGFAFTDGHAIMSYTDYYDNLADLDKVDWQAYGDTTRCRQTGIV